MIVCVCERVFFLVGWLRKRCTYVPSAHLENELVYCPRLFVCTVCTCLYADITHLHFCTWTQTMLWYPTLILHYLWYAYLPHYISNCYHSYCSLVVLTLLLSLSFLYLSFHMFICIFLLLVMLQHQNLPWGIWWCSPTRIRFSYHSKVDDFPRTAFPKVLLSPGIQT